MTPPIVQPMRLPDRGRADSRREEREVRARQDRAGARAQASSSRFDADAGPMPLHVD